MKYTILIVGDLSTPKKDRFSFFDHPNVGVMHVAHRNDTNLNLEMIANSDLIVCEEDWQIDKTSSQIIQIARIIGKEVIHHSRFKDYVEQKNN